MPDQREYVLSLGDKCLEGGSQALSSWNGAGLEAAVKARISESERIIGKQTVQIEILKQILSKPGGCLSGLTAERLRFFGHGICTASG
jgi:hypothetical protein